MTWVRLVFGTSWAHLSCGEPVKVQSEVHPVYGTQLSAAMHTRNRQHPIQTMGVVR